MKKTSKTSIALTCINLFYGRNFKLKHAMLWIYCIDNFTRILKSPHLLFYNFYTNYYEFSNMIIQIYRNKGKGNVNLARGTLQKT